MAKWAHADVLDNGIAYIKTNCDKVAAILAYTSGDSYATVTGGSNILAEITTTSTDFTLAGAAGEARTCTLGTGLQDATANATGNPTHFAFLDTATSKVLYVTEETSAISLTSGVGPVTFPALVYTSNQPT